MSRHRNRRLSARADLAALRSRRLPPETQTTGKSWYRITTAQVRNADGETVQTGEVWLYDEIGYWGVTADAFVRELSQLDVDKITVRVNSPGGEVYDGLAIYNALMAHKAEVEVRVDGLAASIASVISMAGDTVVMGRNSEMMIHDASTVAVGNAADMREVADLLDRVSTNISEVYADRTGTPAEQWRALMLEETWLAAEQAVELGLADAVAPRPKKKPACTCGEADCPMCNPEGEDGADPAEPEDALVRRLTSAQVERLVAMRRAGHGTHGKTVTTDDDGPGDPTAAPAPPEVSEPVSEPEETPLAAQTDLGSAFRAGLDDVDTFETAWDPELFAAALGMVATAAPETPPAPEPEPTPAPEPAFPVDHEAAERERLEAQEARDLADLFRAAVNSASGDMPAPSQPKNRPEAGPVEPADDTFVLGPDAMYNAVREAIYG